MNSLRRFLPAVIACLFAGASIAGVGPITVAAVSGNTITVKGTTYQVPTTTRITVDGLPSKLSDVKPGMVVQLVQGLDRGVAESIVANTIPPKAPKGKGKGFSLTKGSHANVVISITDDRITYGGPGTPMAHAALITPLTRIYVGGLRTESTAVTEGMPVEVTTTDGVRAEAIRANDANK